MALKANIYIAGPVEQAEINNIKNHFFKMMNEKIDFHVERDDSLVGGFLAYVDGKVYDASLFTRIQDIRRYMLDKE